MTDNHKEQPGKVTPGSPGALLRQAREASGQTPLAVGEALHLTVHYIKSLENDEYNKLPGLTFVKGYVRSYARYMKLDVDAVLRCYDEYIGTLPDVVTHTTSANYSYSRKRNDQAIGWAIAAALVVVAGLGAGWWFVGRDTVKAASSTPVTTTAQPANRSSTSTGNASNQSATPTTNFATTNSYTQALPAAGTGGVTTTSTTAAVDAATTLVPAGAAQEGLVSAMSATTAAVPGEAVTTGIAGDAVNAATTTAGVTTTTIAADTATAGLAPDAASADAAQTTTDNLTVLPAANGGRQLTLVSEGSDELQLMASGNSWVEIDDGRNVRIFSEMLRAGDTLVLQGMAPFQVLLGDGRGVQVNFNATAIDISNSIRTDSTARLNLANPVTATTQVGAPQ